MLCTMQLRGPDRRSGTTADCMLRQNIVVVVCRWRWWRLNEIQMCFFSFHATSKRCCSVVVLCALSPFLPMKCSISGLSGHRWNCLSRLPCWVISAFRGEILAKKIPYRSRRRKPRRHSDLPLLNRLKQGKKTFQVKLDFSLLLNSNEEACSRQKPSLKVDDQFSQTRFHLSIIFRWGKGMVMVALLMSSW